MTLPIGTVATEDTDDEGARPEKKPNLMLVPFEALSDDDQTKTLTASVTEEILGALTKLTGIALVTTSDAADYVAKGSVRAAGNRFRTTVQLLDRLEQKPFWSDHFDSDLKDMFEALDNMALRISTALRYEIYERRLKNLS